MEFKVSLFASAIRKPFFETFFKSLESTTIPLEVVFAGTLDPVNDWLVSPLVTFKYIQTANIKPAQCYEVARRACRGELIHWTADDCEYSDDLMAKAYTFWKNLNNRKAILSIQTKENGMFCDMRVHSFFGCRPQTPLMAPLGLMSREYLNELGGYDRRYICGQTENDVCMRAIADGGIVEVFGDEKNLIVIDHYNRHGIPRPFAEGYNHDRDVLEGSWTNGAGRVLTERKDKFEPFDEEFLLTKTQSFNKSRWI